MVDCNLTIKNNIHDLTTKLWFNDELEVSYEF
jgi:hypothetical protein